MTDFLDEKRREITARLNELGPLVDEYNRLAAAASALDGIGGASVAAAAPRRGPGRPPGSSSKTATAATLSQLQTVQNVATARGNVGINESSRRTYISNANAQSTTLRATISSLTDTDVAKAALSQQQTLLQEQALISLASGPQGRRHHANAEVQVNPVSVP